MRSDSDALVTSPIERHTMNEHAAERKRHLAKAVTYRILGSLGTTIIAFAATGDARIGASIGALDTVVKIGFYYAHERVWHRIRWGARSRSPSHARRAQKKSRSFRRAADQEERTRTTMR